VVESVDGIGIVVSPREPVAYAPLVARWLPGVELDAAALRVVDAQLARRARALGLDRAEGFEASRRALEVRALMEAWLELHADSGAEVSEEDLRAEFDALGEALHRPATVDFEHIFFLAPEEWPAEAQAASAAEAGAVAVRAQAGEDFNDLAARHSHLPSAAEDRGVLRGAPVARLHPVLAGELEAMRPGEIRGPIRTPFGYEVVRLVEWHPATSATFEEVREKLRARLAAGRAQAAAMETLEAAGQARGVRLEPGRVAECEAHPEAAVLEGNGLRATCADFAGFLRAMPEAEYLVESGRSERALALFASNQIARAELLGRWSAAERAAFDEAVVRRALAYRLVSQPPVLEVDEATLREFHARNTERFHTPPQVSGTFLEFAFEDAATLHGPQLQLRRTLLTLELRALLAGAVDAREALERLAERATTRKEFHRLCRTDAQAMERDNFYDTPSGELTPFFRTRRGLGVALICERIEPRPQSFEEAGTRVRGLYEHDAWTAMLEATFADIRRVLAAP
jgi:peptidylprolyl isomerase